MQTLRKRQNGCATYALVAAGVLIVAGHALSVDIGNSGQRFVRDFADDRGLHIAGGLITATAALLLSIGLAATARTLADSGRRFARAAATAASAGAAGMAFGLAMVAMVMGALVAGDRHLAVRAYDILNHATVASLPFLIAYLFTFGVLALAASLLRARGRQRWIGGALLVGTMVDFVSPSGGLTTAALHLPQAIAFVLLAVELSRGGLARGPVPARITRAEAGASAAGVLELIGN
jgi:hypothetical protein